MIFDDEVRKILIYCGSISNQEIKHSILVALIKNKAKYGDVEDLFEQFYTKPYEDGRPNSEKDACNYLLSIPLLQKLYDKARARGKVNSADIRFYGKPADNEIKRIKEKIESIY